ncbi:hypothetical protein TSUD_318590 [Trifolium subterraneum]|uniref:F-box domain-containing protein n=1 Tax=Trifolium subterraneum TaxID=3900 RepID=A0A2Z6NQB0_TRISU|nr:hypothetical protein TSUD_318590 [Trifolium subterraneum]
MAPGTEDSIGTIASPSLPLELVEEEILCRLPVKILLQLRCICKSWKSLISDDPKFAKKHLQMSKILKQQQHLIVNALYHGRSSLDYPLSDVFSNISNPTFTPTQLNIPISISFSTNILGICSCDGIVCLSFDGRRSAVLCNPSLRKYSTLPPLENHRKREYCYQREVQSSLFSFGYDHVSEFYKVIAISCFKDKHNEVDVYTLGTNNWRSIQDFPYSSPFWHGVFVGGTVNWLADEEVSNSCRCQVIVSLDLEKESYQKISPPDLEKDGHWALLMFRDCLCISASSNFVDQNMGCYSTFLDFWIMNEYGIKESWTKLYHFADLGKVYPYLKTVYISDDDQVLFNFDDLIIGEWKWVVYNSKNGNVKIPKIKHGSYWTDPEVYVESLISLPCSY